MKDLLVAGRIRTLDPRRPFAEAVLIRDGTIAFVGAEADGEALAGSGPRRIRSGTAVPGLADAHGHVEWLGRSRLEVNCKGAGSAEDCAARAEERARREPAGSWIRGRGWDQNLWPGAAFPSEATLTRAVPDHPAVLGRVDGHASWVNARALAASGIGPGTPDPAGGRILRDVHGRPTGILVDAAQELVLGKVPPPTAAEIEAALLRGMEELVRLGLTSVHDAGVGPETLDVYRRLAGEDRLPLRVYAMAAAESPLPAPEELGRLSVRSVKLFADGALGSRGAALFEDYADDPGNRGLFLSEPEALTEKVRAVVAAGLQPAVHAIGDRAVAAVLDAFEAAGASRSVRPRIEHLQIVRPGDVARLAKAGAVASMQPVHATSDAPWVAARLGEGTERLRGAYAWRTVLRAGVPLAFGSDFPIEDADPLAGIAAAEARTGAPFELEERLLHEEALAAFTRGAAYAAFAEGRRGAIRVGFDADLTLLEGDPPTVSHAIVGGRVEYER